MANVEVPNRLYFSIGDVCKLLKLQPYVLRFWEKEFPSLAPMKGANGRRMYRKKDVEMVIAIKTLLYEQGFTIAGARRTLADRKRNLDHGDAPASPPPAETETAGRRASRAANAESEALRQVQSELQNILTILNRRC